MLDTMSSALHDWYMRGLSDTTKVGGKAPIYMLISAPSFHMTSGFGDKNTKFLVHVICNIMETNFSRPDLVRATKAAFTSPGTDLRDSVH